MTMGRWMGVTARGLGVVLLAVAGWACEGEAPPRRNQSGIASVAGSSGAAGLAAGGSAAGASGAIGTMAGAGPAGPGGVGVGAGAGAGGMAAAGAGSGGSAIGGTSAGGASGAMSMSGSGGRGMPTGGGGASAGTGGTMAGAGGAPASGELEAVRQACVDTINMYRATLNLMPLKRATAAQETCSDMGAKLDGDSGRAHGSAGMCSGLGGQNSCPGYPLRVGGGTLDGTLKFCLKQMWDEGEPAEGVAACKADRSGCFQEHGHWINMSEANYGTVACGFYKMANGSYWMNQNFGR